MYFNEYYDELYHHGIFGQRWGIRRYQNPDGSLTEAGRKRYGVDGGRPGPESGSVKTKSKLSKSDIENMSDEDLRKLVQRTELEKRYEQITKEPEPKKELTNVQKTVNYVSEYGGKALKLGISAIALATAYKKFQESYGNKNKSKVTNNELDALKKKIEELQASKNSSQVSAVANEVKTMSNNIAKAISSSSIPKSQSVSFGKEIVKAMGDTPAKNIATVKKVNKSKPLTMYNLGQDIIDKSLLQMSFSDFMKKYGNSKITSPKKGITSGYGPITIIPVKSKKR